MKKLFPAVIVFAVILMGTAFAETIKNKAVALVESISKQVYANEIVETEELFSSIFEAVPNEAYVFFSDAANLNVYVESEPVTGELYACSFATKFSDELSLIMDCCSFVPMAMLECFAGQNECAVTEEEIDNVCNAMLGWKSEVYDNALSAFIENREYQTPILETDSCVVVMAIVSGAEGATATISYYFKTPVAEQTEEPATESSDGSMGDVGPADFEGKAAVITGMLNAYLKSGGFTESDMLFSDFSLLEHEELPGVQIFYCTCPETDLEAVYASVANKNDLSYVTFSTTNPKNLLMLLNCGYFMPQAQYGEFRENLGWIPCEPEINEAIGLMVDWGKQNTVDAVKAFVSGTPFIAPVFETDFFRAELFIKPMGSCSIATVAYYFSGDMV